MTLAESARPDSVARPAEPRRLAALILLCAANFMVILDAQSVIMGVPVIAGDLGLSPVEAQWILSANLLTFGGLLLLGGRAADLLGRRKLFMVGTALFLLVSLLSAVATAGPLLLAARSLHGVSAALMAPTALAILTDTFPEGRARNRPSPSGRGSPRWAPRSACCSAARCSAGSAGRASSTSTSRSPC